MYGKKISAMIEERIQQATTETVEVFLPNDAPDAEVARILAEYEELGWSVETVKSVDFQDDGPGRPAKTLKRVVMHAEEGRS